MNFLQRVLCLVFLISMSGCATNSFSKTQLHIENTSLKETKLYIYSFLDVREEILGTKMLDELDRQLLTALKDAGVTVDLLRYKDSEAGAYFASTISAVPNPVRETVTRNWNNERKTGAQYRLTVEPFSVVRSGSWRHYEIRWSVMNATTGELIWSSQSSGKHINAVHHDEDPELRAKTIVDGVIQEMRASKLI